MNTRCGWRNHKTLKIGGTACKWGNITDTIDEAVTRLRGSTTNLVQIEHMDALRLIERYDSPDVLMYLDPPYVRSARKSGRMYNFEMDDLQQENFLDLILRWHRKSPLENLLKKLFGQISSSITKCLCLKKYKSTCRFLERCFLCLLYGLQVGFTRFPQTYRLGCAASYLFLIIHDIE